ncbi:MAG: YfbM family protein [Myxococcota bacterium]
MILTFTTARDGTLAKLRVDPDLVWQVLDPEGFDDEAPHGPPASIWSKLVGHAPPAPPPPVPRLLLQEGEGESFDVDKAWHGLHFLLTGTDFEGPWPACFICKGGYELEDGDNGYGPPRLLSASQVQEVSGHLDRTSDESLRTAFDPEAMSKLDIYPDIWISDPEDDDTLDYLMVHMEGLRTFVRNTSAHGLGLIIDLG